MIRPTFALLLALLSIPACDPPPSSEPPTSSATSSSSAPAVFDVEGFCERTMALAKSRRCEGDDELIEGNKVGYCTTMLREVRAAGRVRFDPAAAARCEAAVKGASDLPDRRVLRDLSVRLEACRAVVTGTEAAGAACEYTMECAAGLLCVAKSCQAPVKEGQACSELRDNGFGVAITTCAPPLACREGKCAPAEPGAATSGAAKPENRPPPKKKAGESCTSNDECLGRCSRGGGSTCVSYCGSG